VIHPRVSLALALCVTIPGVLAAQAPRIAIEAQVSGLPGNALWGERTTRDDRSTFTGEGLHLRRTTEVARDPMALFGGRLTFALAGSRWRVVLEGGGGGTRMRTTQREHNSMTSTGGSNFLIGGTNVTSTQDVTMIQVGVRAERAGRWRRLAVETGGGLLAQRLRTHEDTMYVANPLGPDVARMLPSRTYTDPAIVFGTAIGPSSGVLSGLRLAVRSTHVWRTPDLPNDVAISAYPELNAKGRAWQWQPELSVGWRVWL
jgi:hypothetical protein